MPSRKRRRSARTGQASSNRVYAEKSLTSRRREMKIAQMADYFVTPAPIPSSVAVFSCRCGATKVEYDATEVAPPDWSTADDGSHRCPVCTAEASTRER